MLAFGILLHLLAIVLPAFANSVLQELDSAAERYEAKNTLKYGDTCDYPSEERRMRFEIGLNRLWSEGTTYTALEKAATELDKMTDSNKLMCDYHGSSLNCNKETNKCDCVKYNPEMPVNLTTIREGEACRATQGSTCMPTDPCVSGKSCRLSNDGVTTCTAEMVSNLLKKNISSTDFLDMKAFYLAFTQGICKCL